MKGKKLAKILTVAIATALVSAFAAGLTACSGDGEAKTITGSYSYHTYEHMVYGSSVDWDVVNTSLLQLYSDNTYVLTVSRDLFGTDYEGRGLTETITVGTYTSAASADGDASHLDVTLNAATSVIYTTSGKIATNGSFTLNSEKWNAKMAENYKLIAEEGASTDTDDAAKQAFVAQFGGGYTVTIQEPSLDPENPSLYATIISIAAAE